MRKAIVILFSIIILVGFQCLVRAQVSPIAAAEIWYKLNEADIVFTVDSANIVYDMTLDSYPPVYQGHVTFKGVKFLRAGALPSVVGYSYGESLIIPAGGSMYDGPTKLTPPNTLVKTCNGPALVAVRSYRRFSNASVLLPLTPELKEQAEKAVSLPVGWYLSDGKLESPWQYQKAGIAYSEMPPVEAPQCDKTKRPALLAGNDIMLSVTRLQSKESYDASRHDCCTHKTDAPPREIPSEIAKFEIAVTNKSDSVKIVPALLFDGSNILWHDSVFLIRRDDRKFCFFPSSKPFAADIRATQLKPHETVKGVLDTSVFKSPEGFGSGFITYRFCLGELMAEDDLFFQYRGKD